jgi:O-antigen/teichoic acid export membrane protein
MNEVSENSGKKKVTFPVLLRFFIPLAITASLVTISHVIINSTLARSSNPAIVIASYSVAMSLFGILERCAIMLRQTSSALVRDKVSFRQMSKITIYVLTAIFMTSIMIALTPIGKWVFSAIFNVKGQVLDATIETYRILLFVTLFSGIRCLFQGVIISNMRTKWLTLGMFTRLVFMGIVSLIVIKYDLVHHGSIGAYIFLIGMSIEATVSFFEGRYLVKKLPEKKIGHQIEKKSQILHFYWPLLSASLIAVIISPAINIILGWSEKAEIAIASYAIAFSVTQLFISLASYFHQIVINFYEKDSKTVTQFTLIFSMVPTVLLSIIAYTPVGIWVLENLIGVKGNLLSESLVALKFFVIMSICFPWLDFANGVLMVKRQTKIMSFSQIGNVAITVSTLFVMIIFIPSGGGMIGAVSQSIGVAMELVIVLSFLYFTSNRDRYRKGSFRKKYLLLRG